MEDQTLGPGLARNLDFAKGERFEPKLKKIFQNVKIGKRGAQISIAQTYYKRGPLVIYL